MPQDGMDWWVIVGALATLAAVAVAFLRRPRKTDNSIENGSHNRQRGGDGTTTNRIKGGDHNDQSG